jgi:hypothetical protein
MKRRKILLLCVFTLAAIIVTLSLKPLSQEASYHLFADSKTILGVSNFLNVVSNAVFLIIGVYGFMHLSFVKEHSLLRLMYVVLYTGFILTAIGSAYYHYFPANNTLVYDRIPMTIVFMSLTAIIISKRINQRAGIILFFPLIVLGVASVLWWHYTQLAGRGDLRFYGMVQFYPILLLPLIYILFPPADSAIGLRLFLPVIGWYLIAKLFESFDKEIFLATTIISGHTLKHLAAGVACFYIVKLIKKQSSQIHVA